MKYYIFEDLETATAAEQWICDKLQEHGIGFKRNPGNVTVCYAKPEIRETDLKPYFARMPDGVRGKLTEDDVVEFMTLFSPMLEEYDESWGSVAQPQL